MNNTIIKFGYPSTLIKEYKYWVVLLREKQITIGSLVIICKEEKKSVSTISSAAFSELQDVLFFVEKLLKQEFKADKINYLTLMMIDPHVHTHVIPRYSSLLKFNSKDYLDANWPGPPTINEYISLSDEDFVSLLERIKYAI